ncbi:hypothetical protein EKO27_g4687 [Xylaria grammica]|uniref:Zn(2)-C6 fungal-type domain-containing protein n=1 Tax=Xylaria grammica TaxID=363999 RepID=A0A439D7N1_9PEZI|nr:hypothetical protein EKO27_g4687 [Xylaria grammica]
MRSSIACTRCRKSKIKCENANGKSPCDSCLKTGNVCIFKVPDPTPPKRPEPPAVIKQERDGGSERKRIKKIDDASKDDGQRALAIAEDVLSASFLTEDLWEQVLDLYKLHFAPELSFLHLPTMKEKLGRRSKALHSEHSSEHSSDTMALGPVRTTMSTPSVDRVAALLMLGLYEWSQTQPKAGGMMAWMYVGTAIRMAQFLGLGFEDAKEPGDAKFRAVDLRLKNIGCQSQLALQKEIRRRIMFSCFILDRMLACGKHRVAIIRGEDLDIQLPCSEDKFDLAMEVQTGRLSQLDRTGSDDSVLSRFIQLVSLWGEISKYSARGGRVKDKHAPWHPESDFYNLTKALETFDLSLPASSTFVLLHMLRFVCLIMLHREYVPFVPIRCREPEGPLDQPTFTKEETPAGFWRASAEQLFKAARGIVDLIKICQRKDKLPQSTIVLFAIWTAAFVGLYGVHFPQMDTEKYMLNFDYEDMQEDGLKDVFKRGPTALTFQTLMEMSTWQKMASTYVDILRSMNDYFDEIKRDYYIHSDKDGRPNKAKLRVREGGTGGALEEYQPLDKTLKDFGSLQPDEPGVVDISERLRIRNLNRPSSTIDSLSVCRSAPPVSFTAINHGSALPTPEPLRPLSLSAEITGPPQMRPEPYAESQRYQHTSQQQTHSPPSKLYPTPGSALDLGVTHTSTYEPSMIDDGENFWDKLQRDELHRFGVTGDLSLFSTGQSEVSSADMPFGRSSYIPIMSGSSYQLLQQAGDYSA